MIGTGWINNFTMHDGDIDFLVNLLLEGETPLTTVELARALIEQRLQEEQDSLLKKYEDTQVYRPANQYAVGDRIVFTQLSMATATITDVREGKNPDYGEFEVIRVEFDASEHETQDNKREFAANFHAEHPLNELEENSFLDTSAKLDPNEILSANSKVILQTVFESLKENASLERVAGYWFPRELVLECDIGVMHLAEAVLDMAGGGPLSTESIIEQIGGIGDAPMKLQVFSLNLALDHDDRFDEVGPSGQVLWFLNRMEPEYVRKIPRLLQFTPIEFDDDLLSDEMFDLETELDDEHTAIEFEGQLRKATTTLIYPHRRAGTLPLNAKTRTIFPVARTPRIYVEFIDKMDDERFNGWVVHDYRYVYGLLDYYTKHRLPVGAHISVEAGEHPGQIIVSYNAYKPRTEWIRLVTPSRTQLMFEIKKRAIGADYDELITIGVDDLDSLDVLVKAYENKPLASIVRDVINGLSRLTPQGTVHATTIYSAVNLIRRCAPGPLFATLSANRDFDDVGDHYWTLSENE